MPLAIPGLAAVAAALVAMLLIWAIIAFAKAVAGLIPNDLPIIGASLHNLVEAVAVAGSAAIQWIMADIVRPIINLVMGPVVGFINFLAGLEHFASSMAGSWLWLLQTAIPRMITNLEAITIRWAHAAEAYAVGLVHSLAAAVLHDIALARSYAYGIVHSLAAAVLHDIALARGYALSLVDTLAVDVTKDLSVVLHTAESYAVAGDQALGRAIHSLAGTVVGFEATSVALINSGVARAISVSEAWTVAEVSRAIHLVDVEAAAGIAAVAPDIIVDVGKLIDVIGTDLPAIGTAARAIPTAIPTDLAGALGLTGALALPMIRYLEQCGIPNCRNLSQYGRELKDLLNVLEDGSLIAFLAMLCTDPTAAADFVANDIAPVIDGAVTAARDLLGVA